MNEHDRAAFEALLESWPGLRHIDNAEELVSAAEEAFEAGLAHARKQQEEGACGWKRDHDSESLFLLPCTFAGGRSHAVRVECDELMPTFCFNCGGRVEEEE